MARLMIAAALMSCSAGEKENLGEGALRPGDEDLDADAQEKECGEPCQHAGSRRSQKCDDAVRRRIADTDGNRDDDGRA